MRFFSLTLVFLFSFVCNSEVISAQGPPQGGGETDFEAAFTEITVTPLRAAYGDSYEECNVQVGAFAKVKPNHTAMLVVTASVSIDEIDVEHNLGPDESILSLAGNKNYEVSNLEPLQAAGIGFRVFDWDRSQPKGTALSKVDDSIKCAPHEIAAQVRGVFLIDDGNPGSSLFVQSYYENGSNQVKRLVVKATPKPPFVPGPVIVIGTTDVPEDSSGIRSIPRVPRFPDQHSLWDFVATNQIWVEIVDLPGDGGDGDNDGGNDGTDLGF